MPEARAVNTMFGEIAGRYDLANHVLSGGVDYYWRGRLVRAVKQTEPDVVADFATGSGDVAFALRKALPPETRIEALDFCEPMLDEARAKQQQRGLGENLTFSFGDCLDLPLADDSIDVATIAFGLRNLEDRHRGLVEMRRVLKPGGRLIVLEFTQPQKWFRPLYRFYLLRILPLIAGPLTGSKEAYKYLGDTVDAFPTKESLSEEFTRAGFSRVQARGLTFCIVALHEAAK